MDGRISTARSLVMDCVIVTQNRNCIAQLDKASYGTLCSPAPLIFMSSVLSYLCGLLIFMWSVLSYLCGVLIFMWSANIYVVCPFIFVLVANIYVVC